MSKPAPRSPNPAGDTAPRFHPTNLRQRVDGWTAARQVTFIKALAATACVKEASAAVGMTPQSAYRLKRRADAESFRQAWEIALDFAVGHLADAALGRALNGVATPIFYKGEQIGERRTYNERLTMFLLRYRRPDRYGNWLDDMQVKEAHPDGPAIRLTEAVRRVAEDGAAKAAGRPRPARRPLRTILLADDPEEIAAAEAKAEAREAARREAEYETYLESLGEATEDLPATPASGPDVV